LDLFLFQEGILMVPFIGREVYYYGKFIPPWLIYPFKLNFYYPWIIGFPRKFGRKGKQRTRTRDIVGTRIFGAWYDILFRPGYAL